MAVRKRNAFLDAGESEDEEQNGYDSDAQEEGRGGIGGRASKRRKTGSESEDESFHSFEAEEEDTVKKAGSDASKAISKTPKSVARARKAARKSGVLYISRVPPFMKPQTLKHYLLPHAPKGLGRIFLTPEDHSTHTARVKRGGNKKKSFTDGWVEFTSKTDAKIAAETLNGNIIGGKKGGFYHDDIWNMKYLKGFKWSHLTEQIANENAERAARLREEVRRTRKENKAFLEDVESGKMLVGMEETRRKKGKEKDGGGDVKADDEGGKAVVRRGRDFKQNKARERDKVSLNGADDEFKRVGSMIF